MRRLIVTNVDIIPPQRRFLLLLPSRQLQRRGKDSLDQWTWFLRSDNKNVAQKAPDETYTFFDSLMQNYSELFRLDNMKSPTTQNTESYYVLQEGKEMTDINWTDEYEALTDFIFRFDYGCASSVPQLYHYRSGSSLTKIFDKDNVLLRLTSADRFDDKLEGRAVEVYYDIALENMLNSGKLTQEQFDELSQLEMPNKLLFFYESKNGMNMAKQEEFDAYVICFSRVQDDPYMYKKYVHNKSTGGFCMSLLGGEIESLSRLGMKNEANIRLIPVMYGGRTIQYIEEKVQKVVQNSFLYKNREAVLGSVLQHVQFAAKRNRYSKENEIRLVVYLKKNDTKEHPNLFRDTNDNGEVKKDYILFRVPKYMVFDVTSDLQNMPETTKNIIEFLETQGYELLKH